ncbi:MAG: hypothetical protein ABEJ36_00315 [Candidatus Nanosalina sp.]
MGEMMVNYSDHNIHIDPRMRYSRRGEVKEMVEYGLRHLNWHPNHGLGFRTDRFDTRSFYGTFGVEDHRPEFMDHRIDVTGNDLDAEAAVRDIYRNAVRDFKDIFDTDFRAPSLVFQDSVVEDGLTGWSRTRSRGTWTRSATASNTRPTG